MTVQIFSPFLLIVLGKWAVKERLGGRAEDRTATLLKVGNASA